MNAKSMLAIGLMLVSAVTEARSLLVISIDGLHPDYVLAADRHGLEVPNLRRFVAEGAHARGVIGVTPTVTYPSHTTLMTGVAPSEHGIASNTPFDPTGSNRDGWYWYAADIRVPTLWSAAAAKGLVTAAVNWPVTVGDTHIRYLLPEFWRAMTPDDQKLLRTLSRPEGLQAELERHLGTFIDGGMDTLDSDRVRTRFAVEILKTRRPELMAVHLVGLDGMEHAQGPFTQPVFAVLEAIDGMVGELSEVALANDPEATIAIVSDHGFLPTHTAINLRVAFVREKLIDMEGATIKHWEAQVWNGGGAAAVVLRQPDDPAQRQRVERLLGKLAADPANGIARILDKRKVEERKAFPGAEFLVEFAPGFSLGSALTGVLRTPATSRGTHGYLPERSELHAAFLIRGRGIAPRDLGVIDMRQIAPTFAELLGLPLPTAVQPALAISQ